MDNAPSTLHGADPRDEVDLAMSIIRHRSWQRVRSGRSRVVAAPPRPRLLTRALDLLLRRKAPLSGEQQDRLYRLFAGLLHARPKLLPSASRIPGADQHFLLSEFANPQLRRHDGFELAVFDARSATYYRMPRALAVGHGEVAPGAHALRLDHWNLPGARYLQVQKTQTGCLRVASIAASATPGVAYRRLAAHHLDYAKLSLELEEQIHRCFVWHLLSLEHAPTLVAAPDRLTLQDWLDECAGLGPRLAHIATDCRKRLTLTRTAS